MIKKVEIKKIIVVTDDIKLSKELIEGLKLDLSIDIFYESNDKYSDLFLLGKMKNLICSNSCFSYCGALLSNIEYGFNNNIYIPEY